MAPSTAFSLVCALTILACWSWSVIMFLWVVPGPLIFNLVSSAFIIIKWRGHSSAQPKKILGFYALTTILALLLFYLPAFFGWDVKESLGKNSSFVYHLSFLAIAFSLFFFSWGRFPGITP